MSSVHEGAHTHTHTMWPSCSLYNYCSSQASHGPSVFKILILDLFLVMTWIFITAQQQLEGDHVPLNFRDSHLAWLGLSGGGSVSWLFVFLVMLLLSSAHQHFSSTRANSVSAISFVPSCSFSSFASSHFSDSTLFHRVSQSDLEVGQGWHVLFATTAVSMEEVAPSLCGFIWFGSSALEFWNIIAVHYQLWS